MKVISIEGSIGAGKSTLIDILQEYLCDEKFFFLKEPLDLWTSVGEDNDNLLELFYKNPQRWTYTFQSWAFLSRTKRLEELVNTVPPDSVIIIERSIHSDRNCFSKILYKDGKISSMENYLYENWFDWLESKSPDINAHIYLTTSPENCQKRVKKRSRQGEDAISLDYLKKLDEKHKEWLRGDLIDEKRVIEIDGDENYLNNAEIKKAIVQKIANFL